MLCCVCSISIVVRAAAAANKPLKSSDGMWEYLAGVDGHVTITKYIGDHRRSEVKNEKEYTTIRRWCHTGKST